MSSTSMIKPFQMHAHQAQNPSRRALFKGAGAVTGGLMLSITLPGGVREAKANLVHTPNAWVHISDDNVVTLLSARSEMGQGVYTSMPMLIAEELNIPLQQVRVDIAPPGAAYTNALLGAQITGGSTSVRDGWEKLRVAGAQVREMLISAGAAKWNVPRDQVRAVNGRIVGPNNQSETYGALAAAAAKLPVPEKPALKDPSQFTIVGKSTRRLDTPAKVNGTAVFGIDVKLPGMLYASVEQCPVIGGTVKSFDASGAKAVKGVVNVVQISSGVAVVASSYWQAKKGRDALKVMWDEGAGAAHSTASVKAAIVKAAGDAKVLDGAKPVGDAVGVIKAAGKTMKAEYWSPMQAHAPLEPQNFTADWNNGKPVLIGPTQFQQGAVGIIAGVLKVKPEDISVRTSFLGGGFGRRIELDFILQAAEVSKAVGKPVKVLWTREDDTKNDFYRPFAYNQMAAAIGADGKPTATHFRLTSQSVTQRAFGLPKDVVDPFMMEAAVTPYKVANTRHDLVIHDTGLRFGYWRSVSHPFNCVANECFMDELARNAGQDEIAYRMSLLDGKSRFAAVLQDAATLSGWNTPAPGRFRGVALMEGYDTYMAMVSEVSVTNGEVKVHKVTTVVDCGRMVNPDTCEAQVQSSIVFGLTAALLGEITLDKGRVQQGNFNDYPVLRMSETPEMKTYFMPSNDKPGGLGEPATAVIVAATMNAVSKAIGKRVRSTPMTKEALAKA